MLCFDQKESPNPIASRTRRERLGHLFLLFCFALVIGTGCRTYPPEDEATRLERFNRERLEDAQFTFKPGTVFYTR